MTMNIYIEGNIGTGKTTFLKYLETILDPERYNIIYEPVGEWQKLKDENNKNILEHFYEDQEKWAFPFQMNSFISRVKHITDNSKKHPEKINIIERSVFTDKYCFAKNCHETGKINTIEYQIYCNWHTWLTEHFDIKPSGFIYIKSPPEICTQRINKRSRNGEETIPLDYLTKLSDLHDEWLKNEKNVLEIDMVDNLYENTEKLKEIDQNVNNFVDIFI